MDEEPEGPGLAGLSERLARAPQHVTQSVRQIFIGLGSTEREHPVLSKRRYQMGYNDA